MGLDGDLAGHGHRAGVDVEAQHWASGAERLLLPQVEELRLETLVARPAELQSAPAA